jgi:maltooligosyltrehalose synthase
VRVDHVDGLSDPTAYCRRLRQHLEMAGGGRVPYVVVEKILATEEHLPLNGRLKAPPAMTLCARSAGCCMTPEV